LRRPSAQDESGEDRRNTGLVRQAGRGRKPMNNATIFAADRSTHLKIVTISLLASIAVIVIAMMAHAVPTAGVRVTGDSSGHSVKAGRSYLTSSSDATAIR
jgi:hypothetical protein